MNDRRRIVGALAALSAMPKEMSTGFPHWRMNCRVFHAMRIFPSGSRQA
jgi:hypothetical protein